MSRLDSDKISLLHENAIVNNCHLPSFQRRGHWRTDVFRLLQKTPMVHRRKNTPHGCGTGRFVPLGKAQVSSHCHARDSPRQIPRRVSLSLSVSTWRIVNISRGLRNNWKFRGVDGTWTSIDVRAQTARTIVCTGCLAFVILRSLVASFSRTCFRSFVLSPTARVSPISLAHVRIFPVNIIIVKWGKFINII